MTEEPLIHLDLTLVLNLPFILKCNLLLSCSRFIIDNIEFSGGSYPHVINTPTHDEIVLCVVILNATLERVTPLFELVVRVRHRVDVIFLHKRMRLARGATNIEFALEELVNGVIQSERWCVGPADTIARFEPVAARTLKKSINL